MTIYSVSDFRIGDKVVAFDVDPPKNKWAKAVVRETEGEVVDIKAGFVWVDTMFGPTPYKPQDLEFFDAPF